MDVKLRFNPVFAYIFQLILHSGQESVQEILIGILGDFF